MCTNTIRAADSSISSSKVGLLVASGVFTLLAAGCAGVGEQPIFPLKGADSESRTYGLFFDQGDHLEELVEARRYEDASKLYAAHESTFFAERRAKFAPLVDKVVEELESIYAPSFATATQGLHNQTPSTDPSTWRTGKEAIAASERLLQHYAPHEKLAVGIRVSRTHARLVEALRRNVAQWNQIAPEAFVSHDLSSNFLDVYPTISRSRSEFLREEFGRVRDRLNASGTDGIAKFHAAYVSDLRSDPSNLNRVSGQLGQLFAVASLAKSDDPIRLRAALHALDEAKTAGLEVHEVPGISLAFAEVTSATLLKEGQIQFPVGINVDLPFKTVKAALDEALTTGRDKYDYVLAVEVNLARNNQRVQKRDLQSSRFLASVRQVPNPRYEQSRMAVYGIQNEYAANQAQYCQGYGCLGKAIVGIAIASRLKEAQQLFAGTPMLLSENVYQDYKYSVSDVNATKTVTAHYYIVDVRNNRYFKSAFDISEEKSFRLVYNVHDKDESRNGILSRYDSEKDLKAFDERRVEVRLSDVVAQFAAKAAEQKPYTSLTDLRDELLKDKNRALSAFREQARKQSATTKDDQRFESVVVVLHPKGGIGSGFFVEPDLVLTNYHVVDGAEFVELKLNNGLETFGKVVRSDVRLDLALIRTQARGKPVTFHNGPIQLGSTVEAIGHPSGLEFTITRGVVSALRKRPSPFGVGGAEILFVQTDTPINPGNSGGPLFLEGVVIAVNNNKLVGRAVEGIGFSIHYTEVEAFMSGDR